MARNIYEALTFDNNIGGRYFSRESVVNRIPSIASDEAFFSAPLMQKRDRLSPFRSQGLGPSCATS
jgi:hypothetical protein